jgi:hypothetical protein
MSKKRAAVASSKAVPTENELDTIFSMLTFTDVAVNPAASLCALCAQGSSPHSLMLKALIGLLSKDCFESPHFPDGNAL